MGLIKKLRTRRNDFHTKLRAALQPAVGRLGTKLRIRARMRLANRWAAAHPKKTFAITVTVLTVEFFVVTFCFPWQSQSRSPINLDGIDNIDRMFVNRRKMDNLGKQSRQVIEDEVEKSRQLRSEIDSLLAVPEKTAADSARIIALYNEFQAISTTLTTDEKD